MFIFVLVFMDLRALSYTWPLDLNGSGASLMFLFISAAAPSHNPPWIMWRDSDDADDSLSPTRPCHVVVCRSSPPKAPCHMPLQSLSHITGSSVAYVILAWLIVFLDCILFSQAFHLVILYSLLNDTCHYHTTLAPMLLMWNWLEYSFSWFVFCSHEHFSTFSVFTFQWYMSRGGVSAAFTSANISYKVCSSNYCSSSGPWPRLAPASVGFGLHAQQPS